jgi:UbiD family decarboxylase
MTQRGYNDLQQHIEVLRERGLLWEIDDPIDKDAVMHPFVRWQFRGGIPEAERRAFLFTNVVDGSGRRYENPVLIAGIAGSPDIYAAGLGCKVEEVPERWRTAYANPIEPVMVDEGQCQDVVITGDALKEEGGGLLRIPMPISTPGFDNAPYLNSAHTVSKDPETGIRNIGHYRGQIRGTDNCSIFFSATYKHGYMQWKKAVDRGEDFEVAVFVGAPVVAYAAVQKVPFGVDEYDIAGGLAQEPIQLVKCKTVDIEVPADAELVIEGRLTTDYTVPEGPFGESHGYVHPRGQAPILEVTAITHRESYVWTSFMSQVTPSESSVIKKVGFEPMVERYLRDDLGIDGVERVVMHEPLTNLRKVIFVQFKFGAKQTEVWRALKAVASYKAEIGKIVVAVDEDIDLDNLDAVWWAIAYRQRPHRDIQILEGQYRGHGPPFVENPHEWEDSNMLINATLKFPLPPVSLPTREYMDKARGMWEEIGAQYGLPALTPEAPWHGYVITEEEWPEELEEEARLAADSRYFETGTKLARRREPS